MRRLGCVIHHHHQQQQASNKIQLWKKNVCIEEEKETRSQTMSIVELNNNRISIEMFIHLSFSFIKCVSALCMCAKLDSCILLFSFKLNQFWSAITLPHPIHNNRHFISVLLIWSSSWTEQKTFDIELSKTYKVQWDTSTAVHEKNRLIKTLIELYGKFNARTEGNYLLGEPFQSFFCPPLFLSLFTIILIMSHEK